MLNDLSDDELSLEEMHLFKEAIDNDDEIALKTFIAKNADEDDNSLSIALAYAFERKKTKLQSVLIQAIADNKIPTEIKRKEILSWCLLQAATMGFKQAISELCTHGANINAADEEGQTAIYYAINKNHQEIVNILIKKGANLENKDEHENTPLFHAIKKNKFEIAVEIYQHLLRTKTFSEIMSDTLAKYAITKMLKYYEDGKKKYHVLNGPLHWAAKAGAVNVVNFLITQCKKDITIDDLGHENYTPLHFAAEQGHTTVIKILLAAGANINAETSSGNTALLLAVSSGKKAAVQALVENNARMVTNHEGDTPYTEAIKRQHFDCAAELAKYNLTLLDKEFPHRWRLYFTFGGKKLAAILAFDPNYKQGAYDGGHSDVAEKLFNNSLTKLLATKTPLLQTKYKNILNMASQPRELAHYRQNDLLQLCASIRSQKTAIFRAGYWTHLLYAIFKKINADKFELTLIDKGAFYLEVENSKGFSTRRMPFHEENLEEVVAFLWEAAQKENFKKAKTTLLFDLPNAACSQFILDENTLTTQIKKGICFWSNFKKLHQEIYPTEFPNNEVHHHYKEVVIFDKQDALDEYVEFCKNNPTIDNALQQNRNELIAMCEKLIAIDKQKLTQNPTKSDEDDLTTHLSQ